MQPDRDDATLIDLVRACSLILEFTRGLDRAAFVDDEKTQSSVIHQFLILGEASRRLSENFRAQHAEIEWAAIIRMRDKLIHHYEKADPNAVWQAVQSDIPEMLAFLEDHLPNHRG